MDEGGGEEGDHTQGRRPRCNTLPWVAPGLEVVEKMSVCVCV